MVDELWQPSMVTHHLVHPFGQYLGMRPLATVAHCCFPPPLRSFRFLEVYTDFSGNPALFVEHLSLLGSWRFFFHLFYLAYLSFLLEYRYRYYNEFVIISNEAALICLWVFSVSAHTHHTHSTPSRMMMRLYLFYAG